MSGRVSWLERREARSTRPDATHSLTSGAQKPQPRQTAGARPSVTRAEVHPPDGKHSPDEKLWPPPAGPPTDALSLAKLPLPTPTPFPPLFAPLS
uniref:Uncharacterized protein n=1 Tax=Plectus sambesii TaxID=2011161 RepID=A0A914URQ7_9BILA